MKKVYRIVSLMLVMLLIAWTLVGCSQPETVEIHNPGSGDYDHEVEIDLSMEMVPLTAAPAIFSIPMPTASGTQTNKNQKAEIDYSNAADGYIMVRFLQKTDKQLRVQVTGPSNSTYTYTLKQNGDFEVFPLSDGSGSYKVGVFEQIEGTRYATANSATISVKLKDEFAPFLRPNQYVNFTKESETVKKATELVKDVKGVYPKVEAIYNFVIKNLTYDKVLAANVKSGYLPNLDAVLKSGKGICFDYAALMSAMLRSQGIPSKLVIGYAGTVYHAWINVYSEETGWINNIIMFDGRNWNLMDPTFASTGNQSADVMKYIGDGTNYSAKFLY